MKNKSVSDFVAATMDAVLNSEQHKSLFRGTYKYASEKEDVDHAKTCKDCHQAKDMCMCMADDNALKHSAKTCKDCHQAKDMCMCMADDNELYVDDDKSYDADDHMSYDADDHMSYDSDDASMKEEMSATAAFDVAIDGLLTASAALDAVGMSNSSTVSLKLASLVVEAKKAVKEEKKEKSKAKGKKPAKKLTSKDFKEMEEADVGSDKKLTSVDFKKQLSKKKS